MGNLELTSGVEDIIADHSISGIGVSDRNLIVSPELIGSNIDVYTIAGVKVFSTVADRELISLEQLTSGVYVVIVRDSVRKVSPVKFQL